MEASDALRYPHRAAQKQLQALRCKLNISLATLDLKSPFKRKKKKAVDAMHVRVCVKMCVCVTGTARQKEDTTSDARDLCNLVEENRVEKRGRERGERKKRKGEMEVQTEFNDDLI